jgi:hypothetical protein
MRIPHRHELALELTVNYAEGLGILNVITDWDEIRMSGEPSGGVTQSSSRKRWTLEVLRVVTRLCELG